ncbi:probable ATP-dependent RNA helicase DDX46 [Teleopsis dalmanni]|nr:probable ATP-dependent RNA helicase DDX46 [Teleopsis dalmanni]
MGFEPQVMRIIDNVRPDRQTVMFSATFPRQMEALARRILKRPIEVIVGGRSVVCKDVEQHVAILEDDAKFFKLLELLGHYQEEGSIIVFVDKQENADILLKDLMKASYPCMSLHGGIDQFDRDSTIIDFKSGRVRLLIATSVAARGLDVKDLILVVNYDVPNHYEDYVHRCGRTGRAGNKGVAWTFLTNEQARYAGDIIRALELSETEVPEDLQKLWTEYKEAQEAEGKKVHTGGGFSGKGFKFDEQEANAAKESKKLQKAALGLADSDDEEDIEQDIDQQIEQLFAAKRTVKDTSIPVVTLASTTANTTATAAPIVTMAGGSDKLELAKRLASKISTTKNLAPETILKGTTTAPPILTARTVVEQLAAKLNNKLNYQPKDDEEGIAGLMPNQANSFTKYEEELEINDFPQQARWKVTSKEALAQISEYSEAGLTVRGTYVPTGKNPPEGERKLYLAIESCSELAVQKAKREITRLIKEELLKLSSAHHVFNKNRYKVL